MKQKIFCIILSLAMIFTMMPAVSSASSYYDGQYETGMCGENTTYILDKWNGTLEINGTGAVTIAPWETNNTAKYIESLKIGSGVTRIDEYVFNQMKNLSEITVDENNAYYCSDNHILYGNNKTAIIWVYDFYSNLYIPDTVEYIYSDALNACKYLSKIEVDENNSYYSSEDGVLFNKDKTELIRFPRDKFMYNEETSEAIAYTIPNSVRIIREYAFYKSSFETVVLNNNVKEIGFMAFYDCEELTSIVNAKAVERIEGWAFESCRNLKSITLGSKLTYIGDGAFYGCQLITDIQLPSSITEINRYTFFGCTNLQSIVIPTTVGRIRSGAFENCSSLKEVKIPEGIKWINPDCFRGCKNLTNIELPSSIKRIKPRAFKGCTSLASINIPESVVEIGDQAFMNCRSLKKIVLQEGIQSISPRTFKNCSALSDIIIPESVSLIECEAFMNCISLKKIVLPKRMDGFGYSVFYNSGLKEINFEEITRNDEGVEDNRTLEISENMFAYTPLEKITIPDEFTYIGEGAFLGCSELVSVDMSPNVYFIGGHAFRGCTNLKSIDLPKPLMAIKRSTFEGCTALTDINVPSNVSYISYYAFEGCSNIKTVNLNGAARLKRIESNSFRECSSLSSISLPDTVRYLGYNSFDGCTNLKSVNLNDGLENIDRDAFRNCSSLENIVLPDTLKSLGNGAFSYSGLKSINMDIFNSMEAEKIPDGVFSNTQLTTLNVPENIRDIGYKSFEGCYNLTSVNLNNTEWIDQCAFRWSNNLEYISIPETVGYINRYAFDIDNLKVYFEGRIPYINYNGFNQTAKLKFKCKYIESMYNSPLFENSQIPDYFLEHDFNLSGVCTECGAALNSIETYKGSIVKYPINKKADQYLLFEKNDDVNKEGTVLGVSYFDNPVTEVNIPDEIDGYKVVGLNDKAFYGEASLNKVTLGKYITYIGEEAFFGTGIKDIVIPDSVETIYGSAFNECEDLVSMTIPITAYFEKGMRFNNLQTLNYTAGTDGIGLDYDTVDIKSTPCYVNRYNDMKITFGEGIKRIGEYAFYNLKGVTTYTMPKSLQSIGDYAFYRNSSLEKVKIYEGLETMGYKAFAECEYLESVSLPASLSEMKKNTFEGDENLVLTVVNPSYAKDAAYKYGISYKVGTSGTVVTPQPPAENPEIGDIKTSSGVCKTGKEVLIPVKMESNPGVASLKLNIEFNKDVLELTGISNGDIFDDDSFIVDESNIADTSALFWSNGTATSNITAIGTLAILKFKAKKDASAGEQIIDITYKDAADCDNKLVKFDVEAGYITINNFIYGDIDGDDIVNIDDVTYFERYMAEWVGYRNLTVAQESACDVNNDGEINLHDLMILARNVAKWDGYGTLPYRN